MWSLGRALAGRPRHGPINFFLEWVRSISSYYDDLCFIKFQRQKWGLYTTTTTICLFVCSSVCRPKRVPLLATPTAGISYVYPPREKLHPVKFMRALGANWWRPLTRHTCFKKFSDMTTAGASQVYRPIHVRIARRRLQVRMASGIGFYSQLPISAVRIADIPNANYWYRQFSRIADISNSN